MDLELTGQPVLIIALTVVVGAVIAAAVWLPRTGGGVGGFLARLGVIVLVSTLVVTTVGIVLNRQNAWYASWSDLFGRGDPAQSNHAGGPATGVFGPEDTIAAPAAPAPPAAPGASGRPGAAKPVLPPPLPAPGGRVQVYRVTGRQSGLTGEVRVHLPAGYEDRANAKHATRSSWPSPVIRPAL